MHICNFMRYEVCEQCRKKIHIRDVGCIFSASQPSYQYKFTKKASRLNNKPILFDRSKRAEEFRVFFKIHLNNTCMYF